MTSKKILIVEDEQALAEVLEVKLKKENYEVKIARDGAEGYELIKSWQPDLILLDILMPKMTGYEVLEKMHDEGIKIPVIIISNSGQPVEIEKTKKLGAVDCLVKAQFEPAEVIAKVNKYLDGEKQTQKQQKQEDKASAEPEKVSPSKEEEDEEGVIKVLLVEDDKFLRDICRTKLLKEGFLVHEAIDGEQALADIEKVKPHIVLLDIILPNIDGYEVLTKIRSNQNPAIANVPIIMLSNLGQEDDIQRALDLGANNYLVKAHFTTDEIVAKIKETLGVA